MLLMFAVGGAHLGWMLVLAAVMFVEKAVSWGRRVTLSADVVLAGSACRARHARSDPSRLSRVTIFGVGVGISSHANLSALIVRWTVFLEWRLI